LQVEVGTKRKAEASYTDTVSATIKSWKEKNTELAHPPKMSHRKKGGNLDKILNYKKRNA